MMGWTYRMVWGGGEIVLRFSGKFYWKSVTLKTKRSAYDIKMGLSETDCVESQWNMMLHYRDQHPAPVLAILIVESSVCLNTSARTSNTGPRC
jgi:hypothetical protein